MKVYVRTTGERELDKSYNKLDYELLIDKEHKPVESFIAQLNIISNDDALLIEDDLILPNNFIAKVKKIIKKYPNMIINFYDKHNKITKIEKAIFSNQATFYPKGVSNKIASEMSKHLPYPNYDYLETMALQSLDIEIVNYKPNLVLHKDGYSLITKTYRKNCTKEDKEKWQL